ncbi:MAG: hypothetical protein JEZ12_07925 [Desulfobacterium sp.]|nr:hypothetical protein [Desulfobacterium sp.]
MKLKTIGIIGGKGSMGTWFRELFEALGHTVSISDLNTPLTNKKTVLERSKRFLNILFE